MLRFLVEPIERFRIPVADRKFFSQLKSILGFSPKNIELYKLAMVHRSASYVLPKGKRVDNERLEYLGDAVLDAIVADYLFERYPNQREGFLTKMRAKIVSRTSLNQLAVSMGLESLVKLSNGTAILQKNIYGNALEALIGAIFLDRGYPFTSAAVISNILDRFIDLDELQVLETDFKSKLIELAQKHKIPVSFDTNEDTTVTSNPPKFKSVLVFNNEQIAEGFGNSKKEAEQHASMIALDKIDESQFQ
ncbi:MAG: ribonuclease III [Bacteroidales bacterium]